MLTLLATLASVIFALLALAAHFYERMKTGEAIASNQGVKDQLNALDGQMAKNQGLIDAEKQNLAEKEKNETNQDVLNGINNIPKP